MGYRVLVCDDDDNIAQSIAIYLQQDGYEVLIAHNGIECLEVLRSQDIARNGEIHLVILDIMMPELDGISTLFNLRKEYNVPVIMLSAKSESTDKITGLSFGADDYVTKPCDMLELLARVKSNLRRYTTLGNKKKEEDVLAVGELSIDKRFDKVMMGDKLIKLTPTEYKILCCLMEHKGQVLSSRQIYEAVWNEEGYTVENTLSVHVRRIREKIEINPKEPNYLKAVWGCGYKIEKDF